MTDANSARRDGDDFQARQFWRVAGRLLDPVSAVLRVGFEQGLSGFDDIWVEYESERGPRAGRRTLAREHIQCKWHVTPGTYGYRDVADPAFIHATSRSLLERAHAAHRTLASDEDAVRLTLLTNWQADPSDPLQQLVSTRSGGIRMPRLFDATTDRSKSGMVRKLWREHLDIDDEGLRRFAGMLAFRSAPATLDDLRDTLDDLFAHVGLQRVPQHESAFKYDDVAYKWMSQGRREFDRATFRELCGEEGLLGVARPQPAAYGVKSFQHAVDKLEDRCVRVLDFISEFDERYIRDANDWSTKLYPKLKSFLLQAAAENERPRLALDAHTTLAFAAGTVLNAKVGRVIEIEQGSPQRMVWSSDVGEWDPAKHGIALTEIVLDEAKPEVAVACAITHAIADDVLRFVEASLPAVGRVLVASPAGGVGPQAILSGKHAFEFSRALAAELKSRGVAAQGRLAHLFIAGPNGVSFFLGQQQPVVGRVCLYEFDFEGGRDRTYEPSLIVPLALMPQNHGRT